MERKKLELSEDTLFVVIDPEGVEVARAFDEDQVWEIAPEDDEVESLLDDIQEETGVQLNTTSQETRALINKGYRCIECGLVPLDQMPRELYFTAEGDDLGELRRLAEANQAKPEGYAIFTATGAEESTAEDAEGGQENAIK